MLVKIIKLVHRLLSLIKQGIVQIVRQANIRAYVMGARKPWSHGYSQSKFDFIRNVLNDDDLMAKFRDLDPLPEGYGYRYDERVVEYPWALSRLSASEGKLLDAGSIFNFREIIEHPVVSIKNLTILTLAPEANAFWQGGISYHYGDLRQLPFRENWFDEVCCISTLGHVGMDNRMYTAVNTPGETSLQADQAVKELIRVLRPRGKFLASVVFGKRQLVEWDDTVFAEQFDSLLLKDLLKLFSPCASVSTAFYKYTENGWNVSTEKGCRGLEYFNIHTATSFDPDYAAAARAVALIEVVK